MAMMTTTTIISTMTMAMATMNMMAHCQAATTTKRALGAAQTMGTTPSMGTPQGTALRALEVTIAAVIMRHLRRDLLALTTAAALAPAVAATHLP